MKILLISYGDLEYDGRLRSLLSVFNKIGTVYSFTRGKRKQSKNSIICNKSYIKFIRDSIRCSKKLSNIDILVLDNRKATVPGLIIKKILKPRFVIQDCRELYLIREVKQLSSKIGCIFERIMTKKADVVICANNERAEIMKREYHLDRTPLTYENLRKLEYSPSEDMQLIEKKFSQYIRKDEIRIISSSGCSFERTNNVLVGNLSKIFKKCRLFLVGDSNPREEAAIKKIAEQNTHGEVTILGKLNQSELKYLISQCHLGIVNYGQYDTNNMYCASGKLYEFIYEGIPVVATTNPPLRRICDTYNVGVCDDEYYNGINTVLDDYDNYLTAVKKYTDDYTVEMNDEKLIKDINEIIYRAG